MLGFSAGQKNLKVPPLNLEAGGKVNRGVSLTDLPHHAEVVS